MLRLSLGPLILISLSGVAQALPCDPMDLSRKEPLKGMPILDQDGSGTCYAQTAAQLLEFELRKSGVAQSVSAVDIGLLTTSDGELSGGSTARAIEAALVSGVASKECVDRAILNFTRDTGMTAEQFVAMLDANFHYMAATPLATASAEMLKTNIKAELHFKSCQNTSAVVDLLDQRGLLGDATPQVLAEILYPCLNERHPIEAPGAAREHVIQNFNSGTDESMQQHVDEILNRGNPAGVSICAEVIKGNTEHRGLNGKLPPTLRYDRSNISTCTGHALTAVGRRTSSGGKCQYLLRNSWGGAWAGRGLSCEIKTAGGVFYADSKSLNKKAELAQKKVDAAVAQLEKSRQLLIPLMTPGQDQVAYRSAVQKVQEDQASLESAQRIRDSVTDEFRGMTVVGCWVDSDDLIPNLKAVQGFR